MDKEILAQLTILRRQYFQVVEPSQLRWPTDHILKTAEVQSWIASKFFDTDNITHMPPDRYRLRVLKFLVSNLERSIEDPEEDVWLSISWTLYPQQLCGSSDIPHCTIYTIFPSPFLTVIYRLIRFANDCILAYA